MKVIVLRHGERPKFASELGHAETAPVSQAEDDVSLTERGLKEARRRGEVLGGVVTRVHCSPMRRCVETATAFSRGAGVSATPIAETFLSSDHFGHIIKNSREEQKRLVVHALLSGKRVEGMPDPRERASAALSEAERIAMGGFAALVTHDWWMSLFLANLTDAFVRYDYSIWPEYLESFTIDFGSHTIHYRGEALRLLTHHQ